MVSWTTSGSSRPRCSALVLTAAAVLIAVLACDLPSGARASAIRRRDTSSSVLDVGAVAAAVAAAPSPPEVVREKRTLKLLKLKPLIVLPAKVALGTGAKLVAGAKLGAKAVHVGAKALGASLVGLKAVSKVAKVTVKAATALGVKAVLLNFLFQKINQVIDFKTRLLSNLDQRNKQQNAQFLSPVLPPSSKSFGGSVGNKDDDDFLASAPGDQQVLAQEQSKSSVPLAASATTAPLVDDDEITFDANKVSLQVPDRLFGPSFTAVNSISQTIGNVIQNTAARLARLVEAVKTAIFRKASGVSSISNSSGGLSGSNSGSATRGSRDAASDLGDDGLDLDPLDEAASASASASPSAPATSAGSKKQR